MIDVYHNPEKFGLEILHTLDDPNACYSFDLFVVWSDGAGVLYYGRDSGCSCPSPFDDAGITDLTKIGSETFAMFLNDLANHPAEGPDKVKVATSVAGRLIPRSTT